MIFRRRARSVRRDARWMSVDLDGQRFECLLKLSSARRTLSLRVNRDGVAQVNAPWAMPLGRIETFLKTHSAWLQEQLARRHDAPVWQDGMHLSYLGRELQLEWYPAGHLCEARLEGGRLLVAAAEGQIESAVLAWYRSRAREVLADRLASVCAGLGLAVPQWRLSDAHTRWGSLSAKGLVSLNWRLVKARQDVIDYVVCHELAHIRHRDHSAAFWHEVAHYCPDFKRLRDELRAESAHYLAF